MCGRCTFQAETLSRWLVSLLEPEFEDPPEVVSEMMFPWASSTMVVVEPSAFSLVVVVSCVEELLLDDEDALEDDALLAL
ncbi:hypothetical protein HK22_04090 [Gluconobacter sp. DsW_056]|nr:hypothetical protein HK22_04090 [Gluconobacter sp. DsW_056]